MKNLLKSILLGTLFGLGLSACVSEGDHENHQEDNWQETSNIDPTPDYEQAPKPYEPLPDDDNGETGSAYLEEGTGAEPLAD